MSDDNFGPWIDWAGGPCPIPDAKAGDFEIKLRNGKTIGWGSAEYWATWEDWWQWQGPKPKAIVAYRVRLPAEDLLRQAIDALRELPDEVKPDFIGQDVWCHQEDIAKMDCGSDIVLEVAHPSLHIYEARSLKKTVIADRNERPDAKSGVRLQWRKDWENREHQPKEQS